MLKIVYDPEEGRPIPDGRVETEYKRIAGIMHRAPENVKLYYSTENIVWRFMASVAEGEFDHDEITIETNGVESNVDRYGHFDGMESVGISAKCIERILLAMTEAM